MRDGGREIAGGGGGGGGGEQKRGEKENMGKEKKWGEKAGRRGRQG